MPLVAAASEPRFAAFLRKTRVSAVSGRAQGLYTSSVFICAVYRNSRTGATLDDRIQLSLHDESDFFSLFSQVLIATPRISDPTDDNIVPAIRRVRGKCQVDNTGNKEHKIT